MGVFIPNIGMPESCDMCPIERCEFIFKKFTCQLIEIPDELVEAWQDYIKKAETIGKVKAVNVPKGEMT